ncbi:uncharacterized protein LOC119770468 [Culex quinquefasciatus]|uniref:uncharacterized protein LOC119770468 n=1 Tax=Culex quinquefasciatus TaxID=7176 RepID=UPI0018E2DD55|nr:uncharacterized protein LOC119770468 [Culex quinquefasciatus]
MQLPRPNTAAAAVPANEGARWQQPIRGGFLDAGELIETYLEKNWFKTWSSWKSRKRPASKLPSPSARAPIRYRNSVPAAISETSCRFQKVISSNSARQKLKRGSSTRQCNDGAVSIGRVGTAIPTLPRVKYHSV